MNSFSSIWDVVVAAAVVVVVVAAVVVVVVVVGGWVKVCIKCQRTNAQSNTQIHWLRISQLATSYVWEERKPGK